MRIQTIFMKQRIVKKISFMRILFITVPDCDLVIPGVIGNVGCPSKTLTCFLI